MAKNIIKLLEKDIKERHLSKHKFYQLWNEGKVSMDALRGYAQQYYKFVAEFPRLVSRVHSNTPYEEERLTILENLNEEENPKLPHSELWLRFADGLGLKRNEMDAKMLPETKKMLKEMQKLSSNDFLEGAAALLGYESQISEIAKLKMDGLKKHYGMKDARALEFFKVHSKVDIEHQKTWKKMIAKHARTKEQQAKVRKSLNKSMKAMWNMLDGVYRKYC
ncbi:CADD family putative folate metabolism protein [Candidatus Woesearchaeota archaeon]|nr:CADD family putative folate metabolism protein [Candidatus Woesearchaeota archaeon]